MSSFHIHERVYSGEFWRSLSPDMVRFLERMDYIEFVEAKGLPADELIRLHKVLPKAIFKRLANQLIQGNSEFVRVTQDIEVKPRALYAGVEIEDVPLYTDIGSEDKIFRTERINGEEIEDYNGWPDVIKSINPFQAWVLSDPYYLNNNKLYRTIIKELIESPSGRFRPGVIVLRSASSEEENVRKEKFKTFRKFIYDEYNRSLDELKISMVFLEKEHARSIITNNDLISLSNSVHVYWTEDHLPKLNTPDDHLTIHPGFSTRRMQQEYFNSISREFKRIVKSVNYEYGYGNWREELGKWF